MGEICRRHGVLVISDEIHGDFVFGGGKKHTPFASLGDAYAENSVTCISASKTFNQAGLQCANIVISDKDKRDEIQRTIERNMNAHVNMVGAMATEAAYTSGDQWVDALVSQVAANREYFRTEVNSRVDGIRVLGSDSLYLAWIDCRDMQLPPADFFENFLLTQARVWFDRGPKFGKEGHAFMRANLACPRMLDRTISQLTSVLPRK
ncbi:aminotransferase class I/II-fold pyridoxal phosphate-dependent enzyme [Cupriavidus sp. UYPR2.512]|uniref:aminotransferase class I/II-fold pyridoxal phosphate-dependent enzyme n=1 Tax=Cupriavidus sp. UYPR2.512 TaxID=1080187 RepID=UPI0003A68A40|nr:aminotransferase class I/II-fold pyridoxal phosphate-dependent enzyme [Cupriavidus sp. UYPR2.512]